MFLLLSLITDLFIGAFLVKGVIRQDPLFFKFNTDGNIWLRRHDSDSAIHKTLLVFIDLLIK